MTQLLFRVHAVRRMFQRAVSVDDVLHVLRSGKDIHEHATDRPYPSRLVLGWCGSRPLHVVVAGSSEDDSMVVVTVYEPDPTLWDARFMRRIR